MPRFIMGVLCLMQLYCEYLGPAGSMTVVSLSRFGFDIVRATFSILTIGMWGYSIHFTPRLCRCISVALTVYLSCCSGATCDIGFTMVLLELYAPTFGDIKMPADGYCLYHCFNYAKSSGQAPLTEDYATRLQKRIAARIRRDGLSA